MPEKKSVWGKIPDDALIPENQVFRLILFDNP